MNETRRSIARILEPTVQPSRPEFGNVALIEVDEVVADDARETRAVYRAMIHSATCKAAAAEIARPGFPSGELPRVAPLPRINLGHFVLFDYRLFAGAVWNAALAFKTRVEHGRRVARSVIAVAASMTILIAVGCASVREPEIAVITVTAILTAAGALVMSMNRKADADLRAIRRSAIEKLLQGHINELAEHSELNDGWIEWGTGALGESMVPVLIATPDRPFPGFGRMQVDQVFVTPEVKRGQTVDAKLLRDVVHRRVTAAARSTGFPHVMIGPVVVVDGSSIRSTSTWLAGSGRPYLWVMADEIDGVLERDHSASVRVYLAVQILFPEHQTSATLFLRTLTAGDAAVVEIRLATLGPVLHSEKALSRRLLALGADPLGPNRLAKDMPQTFYGRLFHKQLFRARGEPITEVRDATLWGLDLKGIVPFDDNEIRELGEADLDEQLTHWIGNWAAFRNWREDHSLTLTDDYFGSMECRAALRVLYIRVTESALDALNENGFDISDYRDKDGKWQIHADKIDSIVIGESIVMTAPNGERESSGQKRDDTAKAVKT